MEDKKTRIAFDLGGVIIDKKNREITDEVMMTIKLLIQKFGSDSIFIISKARDKWIESNNRVLNVSGFFEKD